MFRSHPLPVEWQSVDEAIAIAKERLSNASNDMTAWNLQNWLTENFTSDDIDVVEGIFLEFLDANYPKYKRSVEDSSMISTIFNRISDECN